MDENKQKEEQQEAPPVEAPVESAPVLEETPKEPPREVPKKLEEQTKTIGSPLPGKIERLRAFILECKRVLRVTKKPDKQEFQTIVKISAIGMAVIGVIGFLIHFLKEVLF